MVAIANNLYLNEYSSTTHMCASRVLFLWSWICSPKTAACKPADTLFLNISGAVMFSITEFSANILCPDWWKSHARNRSLVLILKCLKNGSNIKSFFTVLIVFGFLTAVGNTWYTSMYFFPLHVYLNLLMFLGLMCQHFLSLTIKTNQSLSNSWRLLPSKIPFFDSGVGSPRCLLKLIRQQLLTSVQVPLLNWSIVTPLVF